jgi:hypothetical protein
MAELRIPRPDLDLVADLVNEADPFLGDRENLCRALPRHLRLYVAAWMLSDGTPAGDEHGLRCALELYEGCGRWLLDQCRLLTTADIVAEVLQLAARWRPQVGSPTAVPNQRSISCFRPERSRASRRGFVTQCLARKEGQ